MTCLDDIASSRHILNRLSTRSSLPAFVFVAPKVNYRCEERGDAYERRRQISKIPQGLLVLSQIG